MLYNETRPTSLHRPLKHFPKDTSEAILGDLLSSCSCPPVAVTKTRKSILGFCLGQGCSAMHRVSGHWGRVLGIPPQNNPICLPSSSTSQVSCCPDDNGLLLLFRPPAPNRGHRPSGQRPAESWVRLCLCSEQVEARPAGALG